MKAIARRVLRLEKQNASHLGEQERSAAELIRERRRQRLAAKGKEPEPEIPWTREDYFDVNVRRLSLAEIIIKRRARRVELQCERALHEHA